MFKSIKVQNFQSLRDIEIDLAPFTVIVGQTDSGKSAFFRAISTLISNRRGSDFITHGERVSTITAELEQGQLKLQRGKTTNDNFYEITVGDRVDTFTKLSGAVPEEVSNFLRIPAKDPINLGSQFDKPFLLDTKEYSSADAARILGALTNVNLMFEGARESNRRKTEAAAKVRTRVADAEQVSERLKSFTGLDTKLAHLDAAEKAAEAAGKLSEAKAVVLRLIQEAQESEAVIEELRNITEFTAPDISGIEKLISAKRLVEDTIKVILSAQNEVESQAKVEEESTARIRELENEHHEALKREGKCPVCGQTT